MLLILIGEGYGWAFGVFWCSTLATGFLVSVFFLQRVEVNLGTGVSMLQVVLFRVFSFRVCHKGGREWGVTWRVCV